MRLIREYRRLRIARRTLHRLGIQAFELVLIEGKAIELYCFVRSAFNARFDGDQMVVTRRSRSKHSSKARASMMSMNKILDPAERRADHRAEVQAFALGLYYVSLECATENSGQTRKIRRRSARSASIANIGEIETRSPPGR